MCYWWQRHGIKRKGGKIRLLILKGTVSCQRNHSSSAWHLILFMSSGCISAGGTNSEFVKCDTSKRQPRGVWGHLISLSPQRQVWFPPSVLRSNWCGPFQTKWSSRRTNGQSNSLGFTHVSFSRQKRSTGWGCAARGQEQPDEIAEGWIGV